MAQGFTGGWGGGPDDGETGAETSGGLEFPADLRVPDDLRDLEQDVLAYHRELAARTGHTIAEIGPDDLAEGSGHRYGRYMLLLVGAMMVMIVFGGMLFFLAPAGDGDPPPQAAPLAVAAKASGEPGGLLPDVPLHDGRTGDVGAARELRPAVLALVPRRCRCNEVINSVSGQAAEFDLPLYVVGSREPRQQLQVLASIIRQGQVRPMHDPSAALASAYQASGKLTLLLVRDDGVVTAIVRSPAAEDRLEPQLRRLTGTAASP
ncbi:MAG: hypothetical protein M3P91_03875 [Actinomycetota bacterium]|nr:hypothetical protein [Actinomycetota bacterium]